MNTAQLRALSARELLERLGLVSVHQLARRRDIKIEGKSKTLLVDMLEGSLFDPKRIATDVADLEESERRALDLILLQGGQISTPVLARLLKEQGVAEPKQTNAYGYQSRQGKYRNRGSRVFEDIVARLGALGLVFPSEGHRGPNATMELNEPARSLFIPDPVAARLPVPSLPVETTQPPAGDALIVPADPGDLLRDVYALTGVARAAPIPLTTRGQIQKRWLVQIDNAFRVQEDAARVKTESELGRLPLLRSLAEEVGLLIAGAGVLTPGDDLDRFLALPSGERWKRLFDAYCRTEHWSELSGLPDVTITPRDKITGPTVTAARQRIIQEIKQLPAERWISLDHLVDRLRQGAYEFLLSRQTPSYGYYYYSSGSYPEPNPYHGSNALGLTFNGERVDWTAVEGEFIRAVAGYALPWLGVVDLGLDADGIPISFRVTADGATLLGGGVPASAAAAPNVVVQPNFQIFAFEPTGEDVLAGLDRFATRARAEQAVEYHLSRDSIYAAQRGGMEVAEILAFLDQVSKTPVPQNVRRSIEDWGKQLSHIVIRRSTPLLQTAAPETLDRLYGDAALGPLLGRRVAPTAAIVPLANLDTLAAALLRTAGDGATSRSDTSYIPALSEGDDSHLAAPGRHLISVSTAGEVGFPQRLPSIFIQGAIRPFADAGPAGNLQLTRESLQRAAKNGIAVDEMLSRLRRLHGAPLPEEVATLVRRWAKDWGKGALAQAAILQVESEEVMADLLADADLKRHLHRVAGAKTLAIVQPDRLEEVRALLEERGMDLRASLQTR